MTSLVRERSFQERTIPQEAKRLANRLSVALAPLFEKERNAPIQLDWDGFATWQNDPDDVRDRRDHLTNLFAAALRAKAESCLKIEWYELVMYAPGTKFDVKTMEVQTIDGAMDTIRDHKNERVNLCVQAALFAYPREDPSYVNLSTCIMSGTNFKTRQDRAGEPLIKAIVVLS